MTEASPPILPLPMRPSANMVTSAGKHMKYFKVQLASLGCIRRFLYISHLLSIDDHFTVWTFPPKIRWAESSPCACCLLSRMPFAIDDGVAQPQHKPGKPAEHCLSTRMDYLTGRVMVTIWEQAVTYVDQHRSCPN